MKLKIFLFIFIYIASIFLISCSSSSTIGSIDERLNIDSLTLVNEEAISLSQTDDTVSVVKGKVIQEEIKSPTTEELPINKMKDLKLDRTTYKPTSKLLFEDETKSVETIDPPSPLSLESTEVINKDEDVEEKKEIAESSWIDTILDRITSFPSGVYNGIKSFPTAIWDWVTGSVDSVSDTIGSGLGAVGSFFEWIYYLLASLLVGLIAFFITITKLVTGVIRTLINSLQDIQRLADYSNTAKDKVEQTLDNSRSIKEKGKFLDWMLEAITHKLIKLKNLDIALLVLSFAVIIFAKYLGVVEYHILLISVIVLLCGIINKRCTNSEILNPYIKHLKNNFYTISSRTFTKYNEDEEVDKVGVKLYNNEGKYVTFKVKIADRKVVDGRIIVESDELYSFKQNNIYDILKTSFEGNTVNIINDKGKLVKVEFEDVKANTIGAHIKEFFKDLWDPPQSDETKIIKSNELNPSLSIVKDIKNGYGQIRHFVKKLPIEWISFIFVIVFALTTQENIVPGFKELDNLYILLLLLTTGLSVYIKHVNNKKTVSYVTCVKDNKNKVPGASSTDDKKIIYKDNEYEVPLTSLTEDQKGIYLDNGELIEIECDVRTKNKNKNKVNIYSNRLNPFSIIVNDAKYDYPRLGIIAKILAILTIPLLFFILLIIIDIVRKILDRIF